jgi:hypothetical protein
MKTPIFWEVPPLKVDRKNKAPCAGPTACMRIWWTTTWLTLNLRGGNTGHGGNRREGKPRNICFVWAVVFHAWRRALGSERRMERSALDTWCKGGAVGRQGCARCAASAGSSHCACEDLLFIKLCCKYFFAIPRFNNNKLLKFVEWGFELLKTVTVFPHHATGNYISLKQFFSFI